ncbi:EEF1A lysine methyltransferase 3 [Callorhinchus milii]|uniref:Protein-lysine methyltransferase METTL21B-like n=1 Tax=Callorhinchus milii TaxID=7868 RepID=V9L3C6_CALMI|nr:EEF1A lysine methyltransferase 3 [Callorhinchus milii]|eukprot:gi/632977207/ref/XP_007905220.1/ PREDICTED: protein-lysine methyltransferase METTL21B-like [Callorhinchus milii]
MTTAHSDSSSVKEEKYTGRIIEDCYEFCGHKLKITRMIGANLQFSSTIWEAGLILCRYFEQQKMNFSGKKVIELGSGTGIVGILAGLLGGEMTLTDRTRTLMQIEKNISDNFPPAMMNRIKVATLNWGENQTEFSTNYDYIIGSDIVYSPSIYPCLIATLKHLSNSNTIIFISTKMRRVLDANEFHEKMLTQDFNSELVLRDEEDDVNVYKITKKCPGSNAQAQC